MPYQTAAEIRAAVPSLASEEKFSDETLEALVAEFEEIAEEYRGVAYESREATATKVIGPGGATALQLAWVKVTAITSVTVTAPAAGGTPTTLTSTAYSFDSDLGVLVVPGGLTAGSKVVVVYTHGEGAPNNTLIRACRQYVRSCALADQSNVPRDVIGQSFEGNYTRYSTPDKDAGRPTGYLDVDRLLNSLPDHRHGIA